MNELCNCIPLDSEDVRRITCLYRLYKRIRDKGYTTSQIEHDVHFINRHIQTIYRQYDNGHAPEEIKLCDVSMATPDGIYSVYTEV